MRKYDQQSLVSRKYSDGVVISVTMRIREVVQIVSGNHGSGCDQAVRMLMKRPSRPRFLN